MGIATTAPLNRLVQFKTTGGRQTAFDERKPMLDDSDVRTYVWTIFVNT
jgi:hypothetical protein